MAFPPRQLRILSILFTLTGATALLVEQAFEKLLSTLLGASTPAAATVLGVYFGGLTLGGLLYGRLRTKRRGGAIAAYSLFEGTVALWALFLFLLFDRLISFFVPLLSAGIHDFAALQGLRVFVAACWILPATIPMGASFPAIADALERLCAPQAGKAMTRFYSYNLLGAILGAVLGPSLIFPLWGLDGALLLTFGVNSIVSIGALLLARLDTSHRDSAERLRVLDQTRSAAGALPGPLLLSLAAGSGFLFFSLEVVWTHLMGAVLGTSIYAFSAMLAIVLIGLGIGGAWTARRFPDQRHIPFTELGILLLAGAIVLALSNGRWPDIPDTLALLGGRMHSFLAAESVRWLLAAVLLLPSAVLLGMIYPSLFRLEIFPERGKGRAAGLVVATNAVGCVFGAFVTGFFLIPRFGSEMTLRLLASLCVALGLAVAVRSWRIVSQRRSVILASLAIALVVFQPRWDRLRLTSGKHVYFRNHEVYPLSRLLFFHEDTLGGITTVVDNPAGTQEQPRPYRTLLTNGKFEGNDSWEMDAQTGFALVPMLFIEHFDDALVIGLGTGHSAGVVESMGFRSVDIAEISPGIVEGARRFFPHINGRVLEQPNVRLLLEDGRNVLLLRPKSYDLITSEITSVWFAGATNVFSREFYRLARQRLRPGGAFQQWLQLHHIGLAEIETAIVTLREEFPYVSYWVVGGQGLLIGSDRPQQIRAAFLDAVRSHGAAVGWPEQELVVRLRTLVASRLLSPEDSTRLSRRSDVVRNTDCNRRIEYLTPRYNNVLVDLRRANLRELASLASFPSPEFEPAVSDPLARMGGPIRVEDYLSTIGVPGIRFLSRPVVTRP